MTDLDEAERIGKLAWDAPWSVDPDPRVDGADQVLGADDLTVCFMSTPIEHSEGNSAWIVYARNHWQAMVDELRRRRREVDALTYALMNSESVAKALSGNVSNER